MSSASDLDEKQAWDRFWAKEPALIRWGRGLYNRHFLRLLRGHTTAETDFLEAGCGTSSLNRQLAPEVRSVTGVDYVAANIRHNQAQAAAQKLTNCTYLEADCHAMPLPDNHFDLVWSQGLLEHYDSADALLREQLRVCRPGGTVLISVPRADSYLHRWYQLTRLLKLHWLWPWTDQGFYSDASLQALMRAADVAPQHGRTYPLKPASLGILIGEVRKPAVNE